MSTRPSSRRVGISVSAWIVVVLICAVVNAYGLSALTQSRGQRALLDRERVAIAEAVGAGESLFTEAPGTARQAPGLGDPVGIVQIPRLGLQQVMAEGADSGITRNGPGHVPGTAGPGQPGNSTVAARRYSYAAPFQRLDELRTGDDIIVTSTQGKSLYRVKSVDRRDVLNPDVYAPSTDDRLTLITSGSIWPWENRQGVVVVATMVGRPFPPTAQASSSVQQDGRHGDGSALSLAILLGGIFAGAALISVLLYRQWVLRSTYLLTTPAMIAFVIATTEAASRLMPGWA